jgi:hypothetical protein
MMETDFREGRAQGLRDALAAVRYLPESDLKHIRALASPGTQGEG